MNSFKWIILSYFIFNILNHGISGCDHLVIGMISLIPPFGDLCTGHILNRL